MGLGVERKCRVEVVTFMCAAGFAAAHDRRTLMPHFPIHECTPKLGFVSKKEKKKSRSVP
jgi:hypothetical protein